MYYGSVGSYGPVSSLAVGTGLSFGVIISGMMFNRQELQQRPVMLDMVGGWSYLNMEAQVYL